MQHCVALDILPPCILLTNCTILAAGKLPVGLGAAAALAACAVIVDAGGQTVRTPTGREYLPYPRTNPDL